MNEQEKYDWMVYVSCMTYNHAPYIVDAMNGFTMQETNFPFVCAVVDDASTDGEQEVIKSYLNEHFDLEDKNVVRHEETDDYVLTFARHKTNKNCYFAVLYLKYNHYRKKSKAPYLAQWRDNAKYIAICEGDDKWDDPLKIQMQVEIMEANPDVGLCYTRYKVNEKGKTSEKLFGGPYVNYLDLLIKDNTIGTLTILARVDLEKQYRDEIKPQTHHWKMGDYPKWLWFAYRSKIFFLNDSTAVYRILPESSSHSKSLQKRLSFIESNFEICYFFNDYFNSGKGTFLHKKQYVSKLYEISLHGDFRLAVKTFKEALNDNWTTVFAYKCYLYLIRALLIKHVSWQFT